MVDALIELAEERPIYVHAPKVKRKGVDPFHEHLTLPHIVIDADKWPELVPDGSIIVVDEAQDLWRPRGPGSNVPEAIRDLETHGHRGIDIFLTTQKPRLIDTAVRDQVGRHVHIRDTGWLGRWQYEWPEVSETLAWKTCKLKKRFKVPKRTFDVYKSANVHTKAPRGSSIMPMITVGLLLATSLLIWLVYRTIARKVEEPAAVTAPASAASSPSLSKRGAVLAVAGAITADTIRASFRPRIEERPETAPAYDELRKVTSMPRITGGYCLDGKCRCYHDQGFDAGLSQQACRDWMRSPPYDPYRVVAEARTFPLAKAQPSPAEAPPRPFQGRIEGAPP